MYIVELERYVWLAPWPGDPGRTLVKKNAKQFNSKKQAKRALTKALKCRNFLYPIVEKIT